jgi:glycerophosphoryl diester phosphodiesterase
LLALEKAAQAGADGVEFDVRLDGAGRVILLHDRTLERVSEGRDRRDVEALSPDERKRVSLVGGERIPELREVLAWAKGTSLRLNVELKSDVSTRFPLVKAVRAQVLEFPDAGERILISSFHPALVAGMALLLKRCPVAWIVHAGQRVFKRAPGVRYLGAQGVHPEHVLLTARRLARLRRAVGLVNTWTVNDAAEARRLAALGVDAIITDDPAGILGALA